MENVSVHLDELMPLITESLSSGKNVLFSPRGVSMLPLLKEGRDTVTLSLPPSRLKKYDIALYRRDNGQYVLHRVVRVGESYTFIGDNQFALEHGIEHSQIIAVCTELSRKGKRVRADSFVWRLFAIFWHYIRFPRRAVYAVMRRVKKLFKAK